MPKANKLQVTQIKSGISYPVRTKNTLKALGFKHLHETIVFEDNQVIRGMLDKVSFLVEVKPAAEEKN
ncbi:MAG TPA: 50S ribosomal protein L30 [Anaerolineaceae bacterium]|nr:50S ribosomal protein L30 [Anaerolineaceae bacterium]